MKTQVSQQRLLLLSQLLTRHTGLSLPPQKWNRLIKGLAAAAPEAGFADLRAYADALLASAAPAPLLEPLVGRLTIGETYFLRNREIFQALIQHVVRGLIDHPRRPDGSLRFWSAGCATGEEPYSIAMLLDHHYSRLTDRSVFILGTDVNHQFLNKAEQGIYTPWSLRSTPDTLIRKYFIAHPENRFELVPRIRQQVLFYRLNFTEPEYRRLLRFPEPMDVIFCRNVLMYHDANSRRHVIARLIEMLEKNGWLITTPAEAGFFESRQLTPVRFSNVTFFRKGPPRKPEARAAWARPKAAPSVSPALNPPLHQPARRLTDSRPKQANGPKTGEANGLQEGYDAAARDYAQGAYRQAVRKLEPLAAGGATRDEALLLRTQSLVLLTRCHANLGELENAEAACRKAIEREKLNPELYYLLATIHQAANQPDAAIRALKQTLYLDPEFIMAIFQLACLMKQKGRAEESRKGFSNASALLQSKTPDDIVPHSDGMTAGRMLEMIRSMI
ncbi:MAG: CheR family methyltransferase [Thermodesulfobacteriota bacterium]